MSAKIKAVAFDAVGTLIEPFPTVAEAYQQAAETVGLELPTDLIRERFRKVFGQDEKSSDLDTNLSTEIHRWRNIVSATLPELDQSRANLAFQKLWDHFAQPSSWRLFPDVREVVDWLDQKSIKVCVASNFDARLRLVWKGLEGVERLQEHLVISSELGVRKPGRGFYEFVAKHLDEPVESILFIGDDWINDVEFPEKIGFKTIILDRHSRCNKANSFVSLKELTTSQWFAD